MSEENKKNPGLAAILRNARGTGVKHEQSSPTAAPSGKNYDAPVITEDTMKDQLETIVKELSGKLERINTELKKSSSSGRSYTMRKPEPRDKDGKLSSLDKHKDGQPDYGAPYYFVIVGGGWNYVPFADKPETYVKGFVLKRSSQPGAQQLELWESDEMYSDQPEVRVWKASPHLVDPYLNAVCDTVIAAFNNKDLKREKE